MARTMCIAAAFMMAAGLVQPSQGTSSGECPSDDQPQNTIGLFQTNLQMNVLKGGAEDTTGGSGRANQSSSEASVSQAEQARRSYLEKVYPMAGRTAGKYSDQQISDLLSGLTLYYEPLPPILNQVPLQSGIASESRGTKMRNVFDSLFQNAAGEQVSFQSLGELIQHERSVFDGMDWTTPRSSWPAWIRESVLDEGGGGYFEVTHFAQSGSPHISGTPDPGRFLDPALHTTAWYYIHRGTGIFYAAGRTKTAINKNHMMLLLIREIQKLHPDRAERFVTLFSGLFPEHDVGVLEASLDATLSGTPCKSAKLQCYKEWFLADWYDEQIVWLARECGYDSIVFAAAPRYAAGGMKTAQDMELVDLRWPVKSWLNDGQEMSYHPRSEVAKEWQRSMHSELILTIRDPFQLNRTDGVRPCQFQLDSNQLYCQGTLSEDLRDKGPH